MLKQLMSVILLAWPFVMASQEKNDTATLLEELVVNGKREIIHSTAMGGHSFTPAEILNTPVILGEPDVLKVFQTLPGVSPGEEGFSGLYVRGGENDQNLFLVDNLPLFNVCHLGGVFSTFNAYSLRKANFFKSAFPARFGDRVSSVTDIILRRPDLHKTTGTATLGLISGNIFLSTPIVKGRTGVAIAIRRTWLDVVTIPAIAILNATKKSDGLKKSGHYGFTDASLRLDHIWNPRLSSYVTAFFSNDSFGMGEKKFDPDNGNYSERDNTSMWWSNCGVITNLTYSLPRTDLSIDAYWSESRSHEGEEYDSEISGKTSSSETTSKNMLNEFGIIERLRHSFSPYLDLTAGMRQAFNRYRPLDRFFRTAENGEPIVYERGKSNESSSSFAIFADLEWNPSERVSLTAGFRGETYLGGKHVRFSPQPRAALRLSLSDDTSIKLGYARTAQFAQQVSSNYISLPTDSWLPTGAVHKPLTADVVSAGIYTMLPREILFSGEIWYKNMDGIAEYKEGIASFSPVTDWREKITFGKGYAYGLDLQTEGTFRNVTVRVSYGLIWNWRKFPALNHGRRFPAKFDNRNKFDISVDWKIKPHITLNAHWQYMTGNRTTVALYHADLSESFYPTAPFPDIDNTHISSEQDKYNGYGVYGERNNVRLPAFHRLNLGVSIDGKLKNGLAYSWNFGLYNAYCRINPFSIKKDNLNNRPYFTPSDWHRAFKTVGLIPVIPSASFTIHF